jgi:hypothetical protein
MESEYIMENMVKKWILLRCITDQEFEIFANGIYDK